MPNSDKFFIFTVTTLILGIVTNGSHAHETFANDPNSGGIDYNWTIEGLTPGESVSVSGHTGSCSFSDPGLADTPLLGVDLLAGSIEDGLLAIPPAQRGWTHTSQWIALELTEDSVVTVTVERKSDVMYLPFGETEEVAAGDTLVPAFVAYKGWDNDASPFEDIHFNFPAPPAHAENWHIYNNAGDMAWAEDLSFFTNAADDGQALIDGSIPSDGVVTETLLMPAGKYSFAVSGFVGPNGVVKQEGYQATFNVVGVPEPNSPVLFMVGLLSLAITARRRRVN